MSQLVISISGPMCAGKNVAAELLEKRGFASIDADATCHTVISKLEPQIIAEFSQEAAKAHIEICNADGSVNRRNLGALLFERPELLAMQEAIVHPEIDRVIAQFIADNKQRSVLINATVLYKTPSLLRCSSLIYVDAPYIIRFLRAKRRDNMKTRQIIQRFSAQSDLFTQYSQKISDIYKVWNCGSRSFLEHQLQNVLNQLVF